MLLVDCMTPSWFLNLQVALQSVFALVALLIAFYSYKVYSISKQRSIALFGFAFLGMGLAYAIQALLNYAVVLGVSTTDIVGSTMTANMLPLSVIAVVLHIFAMTAGLILLSYVTLQNKSFKLFSLIASLTFIALVFATHLQLVFFILTGILLLFICGQHIQRYVKLKTTGSLYVSIGFSLWFLGHIQLALAHFVDVFYVLGHIFMLVAFVVFLLSLTRLMLHK